MMKKLLVSLFVLGALVAAVSCGGNSSGKSADIKQAKMDTPEASAWAVATLKKNIDSTQWKIYRLFWNEGEKLENDLSFLNVDMINKTNSCLTQSFFLSGTVGDLSDAHQMNDDLTFDDIKGITPDMIDPAAIQKQYEAAKAMIPEEYEFKSVGSYNLEEVLPSGTEIIDRNRNIGEIQASFTLNVIEKGKEVIRSAGKESIQYYAVKFNVQPDGSVAIEE